MTTGGGYICGACTEGKHGFAHERRGRCLNAKQDNIATSGSSIVKRTECVCAERPDPPAAAPHDVMHTNTSPLYFPAEVVRHILAIAQGGRAGQVVLDFEGGKLKAWKLTMAGRDRDGTDPTEKPIDIHAPAQTAAL